jgi:hypothetical protein
MAYCTVGETKEILQIDSTDSSDDAEIERCNESAKRLINDVLRRTTDFTAVPGSVVEANKHFGAWLYRMRRAPPEEAKTLYDLAMVFLNAYRDAQTTSTPTKIDRLEE